MYEYTYDYDMLTGVEETANTGVLGALGAASIVISIISLIVGVIMLISMIKVLKKAGKPWWAVFVPIYNIIVMLQAASLPLWYIVLFIIPIANIFAMYKMWAGICKLYGKGTGFAIAMLFVPFICLPILAFSKGSSAPVSDVVEPTTTQEINNDMFSMPQQPEPMMTNEMPQQPEPMMANEMPQQPSPMMTNEMPQQPEPMMTNEMPQQPEPMMTSETPQFKECPNCHTKVKSDSPLCFICGTRLS